MKIASIIALHVRTREALLCRCKLLRKDKGQEIYWPSVKSPIQAEIRFQRFPRILCNTSDTIVRLGYCE
jgi:hypothetical protein